VSRLDFAPKLKEIQLTDIKKGLGVFTPKPEKPVSFAALKATLKKAGYVLDTADITVAGTLLREGQSWFIVIDSSRQRFILEGANLDQSLNGLASDARVEITGDWKTVVGEGVGALEVISPHAVNKAEGASKLSTAGATDFNQTSDRKFVSASFNASEASPFSGSLMSLESPVKPAPVAPIRVTSPGLTVYKGGAVTPRLYLIKQHLGNLKVNRQLLDLSVSYTPTPRLQLEAEVPFSRTQFDDGVYTGSGAGLGNITLWGKYRFFRKVKTYGDRQAAARFGLELPTGKKTAPGASEVNASAFVRQQLTPISGGLSPHFDLAFSQAGGRFIFGGNVEATLRSERDGFRLGNEIRVNTDTEYVLLPRDYGAPGKELFAILETTFIHRGLGRENDTVVPGSRSTEFYLAPGLQYAAAPQFVVEGSIQLPVILNSGSEVLRSRSNLLLGIRYLF
jgi:hypothetical protein